MFPLNIKCLDLYGGIMVSSPRVIYCGFEPQSCQSKDYKMSICCFHARHNALRNKSTDRLAQNQDNVLEWSDVSICNLLQWLALQKSN